MKTCGVKRCTKAAVARNYCPAHYARWQATGDPLAKGYATADASWPACDVEDCSRRSRAQKGGLCFRHYQRLRVSGSTAPTRHYLENIDANALTADCEICGRETPVLRKGQEFICKISKQAQRLRYNYGVDPAVYNQLVAAQGGVCAICGTEPPPRHGDRRLFLDHDHVTGEVREALCGSCNIALGMISDRPELADALAGYLRKHGAPGGASVRP